MEESEHRGPQGTGGGAVPRGDLQALAGAGPLAGLHQASGAALVNRVLELEEPAEFIRSLSDEDFFWLVKKVGRDDALPLLELASLRQWRYLLDLETWQKDRPDLQALDDWFGLLFQADSRRLARWLLGEEGQGLGFYYFYRRLEVRTAPTDDEDELPDGFQTFDGVFYLRARSEESRETALGILRAMAATDFLRYQALVGNLDGLLPAEAEEEMLRLRNVRLAEHGFLPYDEALSVYSALDVERLSVDQPPPGELIPPLQPPDASLPVPVVPMDYGAGGRLLQVLQGAGDARLLDRLRLEFSGLCNQIAVADRLKSFELDDLLHISRKAAGYIDIGLDLAGATATPRAQALLERNALQSVFQVGFGAALRLRWEAERWAKGSWFRAARLPAAFWGEPWGEVLTGMLEPKPRFYAGMTEEAEFRDFQTLAEIEESRRVLGLLAVLDKFSGQLTSGLPLDKGILERESPTFRPLLLNPFARICLGRDPGLLPLDASEARAFLVLLAEDRREPPFPMTAAGRRFTGEMHKLARGFCGSEGEKLTAALQEVWYSFQKEHEWLAPADFDARLGDWLWIGGSPENGR